MSRFLRPHLILLLLLIKVGISSAARAPDDPLVFAGDSIYPPFEWLAQGKPQGFNVDLAREVAKAGGQEMEYRLGEWPEIIRSLRRGDVDVVAMFQSPQRARDFHFSPPFFYVSHGIYARSNQPGIGLVTDLARKRVTLEASSDAHRHLAEEVPDAIVVPVGSTLEALEYVHKGRADYAVLARPTADYLIQSRRLALEASGPPLWPRPYGFAVRADRADLAQRLTDSVLAVMANGRYDTVYDRWQRSLEPPKGMERRLLPLIKPGVSIAAALLVFGVAWVWLLRRTVSRQTQTLATELEKRVSVEKELRRLAEHDPISGLPNANYFLRGVGEALAHADAAGVRKHLAVGRIAELSKIVTTFGQEAGHEFVSRLAKHLRETPSDACGQLGRDTFAVFGDESVVAEIIEAVRAGLEEGTYGYRSMLRVGLATWPEDGGAAELIERAEIALGQCVLDRRMIVAFSAEMEPDPEDMQLVTDFRRFGSAQLNFVYQPKLCLRDDKIVGAEVLARWTHPRLGPVPPGRFIPLLERAALIDRVTNAAINQSADLASELRRQGKPIQLSMNTAAADLVGSALVEVVQRALERTRAASADLILEITETGIIDQPHLVNETLTQLRDLGVKISIDDFGTGYSSLSYLSSFPVAEVKIDRSFVNGMLENERHACLVQTIVDMGHALGLTVVAEGVEDQASLDHLKAIGCDLAQGYFISRPISVAAFREMLSAD